MLNISRFVKLFLLARKTDQSFSCNSALEMDILHWDNCNPETNGEYFLLDHYASGWTVCFDIGANTGEYSARILKNNPDCRVIAFEPNCLLHNSLKDNNIKEIYHAAVSEEVGTININIDKIDSTQSSVHRNHDKCVAEEVKTVTIDAVMQENGLDYISFVKIDTEGHEVSVLRGAANAIRNQRIGMIQFEYGGTFYDAGTTLRQAFELLQQNYLICHLFPLGLLPMPYTDNIETYRYSNWVAIARGIYDLVK